MPDPIEPVIVTVAGTRGSGESGPVTSTGHPVELHVVAPWKIIAVRAAKAGIDTILGAVGGSTVGAALKWGEFGDLFTIGLSVAAGAVVISVLRNTAEYLALWDQKHPTFTA